jgi:hypothetical protein
VAPIEPASYEIFGRYVGGNWENLYFWDQTTSNKDPMSLFGIGDVLVKEKEMVDLTP